MSDGIETQKTNSVAVDTSAPMIDAFVCTVCSPGAPPYQTFVRLSLHFQKAHPSVTPPTFRKVKIRKGEHRCTVCGQTFESSTGHTNHFNTKHNAAAIVANSAIVAQDDDDPQLAAAVEASLSTTTAIVPTAKKRKIKKLSSTPSTIAHKNESDDECEIDYKSVAMQQVVSDMIRVSKKLNSMIEYAQRMGLGEKK